MARMPPSPIQKFIVKDESGEFISVTADGGYSGSKFHTMDNRLMLSIPWDQYSKGYPSASSVSMMISDRAKTAFKIPWSDDLTRKKDPWSNVADTFRTMLKRLARPTLHLNTALLDGMGRPSTLRELHISCGDEECERILENEDCSFGRQERAPYKKGHYVLSSLKCQRLLLKDRMRLPKWIFSVSSLESLEIEQCAWNPKKGPLYCYNLVMIDGPTNWELPWESLNRLESLTFSDLPRMTTLPEGIQLITSLKSLYIQRCSALEVVVQQGDQMLVEGGFTSLTHLTLRDLPRMERLPEGIHQFATPPQRISIKDCENLQLPKWVHNTSNESLEIILGVDWTFFTRKSLAYSPIN